jgi:hypothetical protein
MWVCHIVAHVYGTGDLYTIELDLLYIWRLYRQLWISGTNINDDMICLQSLECGMTGLDMDVLATDQSSSYVH